MKAKKLVGLALPIMLLAGVGCNKDSVEEKKTDNLQVSEEKSQDVSKVKAEKEYKSKLNSLMKDITKESLELNEILNSTKPIEEKDTEFREKSHAIYETAEKLVALDPGDKYLDVQNTVKEVTYALREGVSSIRNGLTMRDGSVVQQGGESMDKASKLIFEVDKKLKETK
ncbi:MULTISPECIES: DUF7018 domain-containing (lipo)protein [Bacillus]|uniref:DUF7018 domain-containing protein n=1 Tax=Bacillus pseudomycoides TaxID=64104 RepID=A0A1Y3ME15_9BACI|nr:MULTISPECIES: hypothetical protein [Bacillus cereus group]EOP51644.1 hypothetical protein IIW_02399 [Bacillus cereus VD136]EOP67683.1 hypothetical protein KOW_04076 [Bacillus cereus VDM006]EOQ04456.1 hypothetical protein KOY_03911 [Bacillus cereus VDM021]OOG89797.1 hypothetical protein BTH41_04964 [Bacillus mycoides]MDF2086686.1 hypothetical protein [Bacillus pseudomycoides]